MVGQGVVDQAGATTGASRKPLGRGALLDRVAPAPHQGLERAVVMGPLRLRARKVMG